MYTPETGTRNIPLLLAKAIRDAMEKSWESGEMLQKVTPITRDLLTFWFDDAHCEIRAPLNFHAGQRRAILTAIYCHEVLRAESVHELYSRIDESLLNQFDTALIHQPKYEFPKYAFKMATGTGKTWVLQALIIWQYLNAHHEAEKSSRFTTNFLIVAPGLIVYERLLDALAGKINHMGQREFLQSDIVKCQKLFLPDVYKEEFFSFLQNNTLSKEEISRRPTGGGFVAVTNWHLFQRYEEEVGEESSPIDSPEQIVHDLLPVTPGTSAGNTLSVLDAPLTRGGEVEYLADLPDLAIFNDEAHHIHENKQAGEIKEVEWQKSLNRISESKKTFIQFDFSATPYDVTGSGQNRQKHFFPHIITDFDLTEAIRLGLVKLIAIDKRSELNTLKNLDYKALRDGQKKVIGLSDGQRLMLRAGLTKLKLLETHFSEIALSQEGAGSKHPKMLVMCEETSVSPFVADFLSKEPGYSEEDILVIDSNKRGEVGAAAWSELKSVLFNIDTHKKPKIIISVLMLREGFDVNNICVIVPLRSSEAPILLEQTVGRGLRLMWREPEFQDIKAENRRKLLQEKRKPENYLDLLSIVEHPAFDQFYQELQKDGVIVEDDREKRKREDTVGDIEIIPLKKDYEKYDLYWPRIVAEAEETLDFTRLKLDELSLYKARPLEELLKIHAQPGEKFASEEIIVKTRFGQYTVDMNLFNVQTFKEYLQHVTETVTTRFEATHSRSQRLMPVIQVETAQIMQFISDYIRYRLFGQEFLPYKAYQWKVLLVPEITNHIILELSSAIFKLQENPVRVPGKIEKLHFSIAGEWRMRLSNTVVVKKAIYEKLPFSANRGGLEKEFMLYVDSDGEVVRFMRIDNYMHPFASIHYMRHDGLLSNYYPDFIVESEKHFYIVETKAAANMQDENVQRKKMAAFDFVEKLNQTKEEKAKPWHYAILSDNHFAAYKSNGASLDEMLLPLILTSESTHAASEGKLF